MKFYFRNLIILRTTFLFAVDAAKIVILIKMKYKIKSILVLLLCFAYFLLRGRANKKNINPQKIAVMQMAKLGDMVCTTPMFRAVKEKYPETEIIIIGNKINKELLEGNSDVNKYFVWGENFWSLVKILKKEKIDFACSTHPNFWGLALLYLAGVKSIAVPIIENGFSPVETRLYKILRKIAIAVSHRMGNYAPREYLRLLEPIGVFSDNTKKYLYFNKQAEEDVNKFFTINDVNTEKDFLVGIAPSVGNKIRSWGGKNFAKIANYIHKKYNVKIIVFGSKNDLNDIESMFKNINDKIKTINTYNNFNIDYLKVAISKLNLFVSVESGPIFIAETFNVPVINLVGPVDDSAQTPHGPLNIIIKADREKPAIHVMNSKICDEHEARRQIKDITLNMVKNKIDEAFSMLYTDVKETKK